MKKTQSKFILIITITIFTLGIACTVFSYSDCLDTYAGEVAAGLEAIDSFYNDDGTFYVVNTIDSKIVSNSILKIGTMKKVWWWYQNPTNFKYMSSIGTQNFTYTIPTGQYKMYFESSNSWITFHGSVYDNN